MSLSGWRSLAGVTLKCLPHEKFAIGAELVITLSATDCSKAAVQRLQSSGRRTVVCGPWNTTRVDVGRDELTVIDKIRSS